MNQIGANIFVIENRFDSKLFKEDFALTNFYIEIHVKGDFFLVYEMGVLEQGFLNIS